MATAFPSALLVPFAWLGSTLPALATLALLGVIVAALVAFESLRTTGVSVTHDVHRDRP